MIVTGLLFSKLFILWLSASIRTLDCCRSFFQLVGDLSELKNKKYEDILNGKEGLEHKSEPDREFNDIQLNDLEVRTGYFEEKEMIEKVLADRKVC
jgi:hypothetical protein